MFPLLEPVAPILAFIGGQTFGAHDIAVIGLLIVLEGVLSIDNALVLGLLAKRLPEHQRKKALTYGLVGAFVFRFIAIATATFLLKWHWVKLLGGGYLVYIALKHFWDARHGHAGHNPTTPEALADAAARGDKPPAEGAIKYAKFWPTVFVIELTDIAFAIDSILAAIALVGAPPAGTTGAHPKLWVVITGGIIGVVLMRFAAVLFIKLLEKFPRFETAAYLLVTVIGLKLLIDYFGNNVFNPNPGTHPVDFHSAKNPFFWGFWISMIACFCVGFIRGKPTGAQGPEKLQPLADAESK